MSKERVTFTFDGAPVQALRGQTVAGALLAEGVVSWHLTRSGGRPRGLFCGIGACFDCLVDVNEDRAVRACLVPVNNGDRVETATSAGPVDELSLSPSARLRDDQSGRLRHEQSARLRHDQAERPEGSQKA
ncbi:MAG TPA: (2Fe-2S)-binding protein [Streptosporangiaceae bacterium]